MSSDIFLLYFLIYKKQHILSRLNVFYMSYLVSYYIHVATIIQSYNFLLYTYVYNSLASVMLIFTIDKYKNKYMTSLFISFLMILIFRIIFLFILYLMDVTIF